MSRTNQVTFHDIYITPTADKHRGLILSHLGILHPQMANFDQSKIHPLFPEEGAHHGTGGWDNDRKHKSLCILSLEDDRIPPTWMPEAIQTFLRPIIIFETIKPEDDSSEMVMYHRSFIKTGWKGHDHGKYFGKQPEKTFFPEDIELIPGPLVYLTPDEIKAQYKAF